MIPEGRAGRQERRPQVVETATRGCQHHWVLSEPRDDVIDALCKRCNATRRYPARLEMTERFDDYRELVASNQPLPRSLYESIGEDS